MKYKRKLEIWPNNRSYSCSFTMQCRATLWDWGFWMCVNTIQILKFVSKCLSSYMEIVMSLRFNLLFYNARMTHTVVNKWEKMNKQWLTKIEHNVFLNSYFVLLMIHLFERMKRFRRSPAVYSMGRYFSWNRGSTVQNFLWCLINLIKTFIRLLVRFRLCSVDWIQWNGWCQINELMP